VFHDFRAKLQEVIS